MSSKPKWVYATYGFRHRARADVLAALEAALGVEFQARDSSYLGEYECYPPFPPPDGTPEGEPSLQLRDNRDPLAGTPAWADHPEVTVVLEVSSTSAARLDEMDQLVRERLGGERI